MIGGIAHPQTSPTANQSAPAASRNAPETVGVSGIKVPIPQIRLEQILGKDRKKKGEEPKPELPPAERISPVRPDAPQTGEGSGTTRDTVSIPAELQEEDLPPAVPVRPPTTAAPRKERPRDRFLIAPVAPEDVMEAVTPKTQRLEERPAPHVPPLIKNPPLTETPDHHPLRPTDADQVPASEWIPFERRKDITIIPPAEPEPMTEPEFTREGPAVEKPPWPPPSEPQSVPPQPPPEPEPFTPTEKPEPIQPQPTEWPITDTATPEPQPTPTLEPKPLPAEDMPSDTISIPKDHAEPEPMPPAAPAPKESVPTPLGADAVDEPEVADYLTSMAPVLESLSLLMTRAPGLVIEDYDPSEGAEPSIPDDVKLKMDAIKRELAILDSKAFSIIPPAKYKDFHSLIRKSISETHQACDGIIAFLEDRKESDLQRVKEHLSKARELMTRTRGRAG